MTELELRKELEAIKVRVDKLERFVARDLPNDLLQRDSKHKEEIKSITAAVERFVAQAVDGSMRRQIEPYAARLLELAVLLEATKGELAKANARAEAEDEAKAEAEREEEAREKRRRDTAEIARAARDAKSKQQRALWAVLGTVAVALIGALSSCAASHFTKTTAPTASSGAPHP